MKSIAVGDYDRILPRISRDAVAAVAKWRDTGNLFGIATGHDLVMIKGELEKWDIPVDFLICTNGSTIYDGNGVLYSSMTLNDATIPEILRHPAAHASMHCQISNMEITSLYLCLRSDESWFPKLGIPYTEVTHEQAMAMRNLNQIAFAYGGEEECAKWSGALAADLGRGVTLHRNGCCLDITPLGIGREAGINELIDVMGWDNYDVLVMGGDGDDFDIIREFGGSTITNASARVRELARKVCRRVTGALML